MRSKDPRFIQCDVCKRKDTLQTNAYAKGHAVDLCSNCGWDLHQHPADVYRAILIEDAIKMRLFGGERHIPFEIFDEGRDCAPLGSQKSLKGVIRINAMGIMVSCDGYGDCGSEDGHGSPMLVEFYQGRLRVIAWSDINVEDPTHTIDMEDSRESKRLP